MRLNSPVDASDRIESTRVHGGILRPAGAGIARCCWIRSSTIGVASLWHLASIKFNSHRKAAIMATQTVAQMTADELLAMPHNGYCCELVQGELRQMAPVGRRRGRIAAKIGSYLEAFVANNSLGETYAAETGFLIDTAPDTVRAPDVSFVSRERAEATAEERGFFPGAPDLAVEVVSPNDRYSEMKEKVFDWLRAGTQMVVVIDPDQRTATVYRAPDDMCMLTEGDVLDGGEVVPGWNVPLADVF